MRYSAAIFDLDGTILDTLDDLMASVNAALTGNGLPARTREEVRTFVGNGIRLLIERSVPEGTDAETTGHVFEAFRAHYAAHCADRTAPYAGIEALLRELRAAGIRTAVVSNKADFAVQALCRDFFDGLFDAVAGEREGVRRKPAPDTVDAVLDALGAERAEAVYIGDSEVDIETARNAGMPCISVTWGFRDEDFLRARGANVLAGSMDELREMLL